VTEWWGAGVVICLEQSADLHMAQLMPLPLTVSCFSKIQIGFTSLVPAHPGIPVKRVCARICCWAPCCCPVLLRRWPCSNRYLLPAGPTAANPPHAAAAGEWDRQTEGRTRAEFKGGPPTEDLPPHTHV